jgi:hypothetical protein
LGWHDAKRLSIASDDDSKQDEVPFVPCREEIDFDKPQTDLNLRLKAAAVAKNDDTPPSPPLGAAGAEFMRSSHTHETRRAIRASRGSC